jgi:pyrimidine-nucleoside phosphorylase
MRIYDIITKKKRGEELSKEEIDFFVFGYTRGEIPDYQISALLMAICLTNMTDKETLALTEAISSSGDSVDLSAFGNLSADKHSTGGVGDKTTLIVAPLAASLGCKVAKMSGRGLGHTGGTIDKLEAFPGYKTTLSPKQFISQVAEVGVAVIGQSGNLAPADKKLYALRDVTATVDSVPLICSSIMGKKLPSGAKNIVLDVKYGSGAFMKTKEDAQILASEMVKIGKLANRRVAALVTDMDTPLGFAIGNSLELKEAIALLSGNGPEDLKEICINLAAAMAHLAFEIPFDEALKRAEDNLENGKAFEKFKEWISAQGGDASYACYPEKFENAAFSFDIISDVDGFIEKTDSELIGLAACELGAGRKTKEDEIDFTAGIILEKKTGDAISVGEKIATLYSNSEEKLLPASEIFKSALTFGRKAIKKSCLIEKIIT